MGYQLSLHFPGAANQDDVRSAVTLQTDEFAYPIKFNFLRWQDDEQGSTGYQLLDYAIERGPMTRASVEGVDLDGYGLTLEQRLWLQKALPAYTRMATCAIETPWDLTATRDAYRSLALLLLKTRAQGKPWTDVELRLVQEFVAVMRQAGYTNSQIAVRLGWHRATLQDALKKAKEQLG
jgi:hypothetical protein